MNKEQIQKWLANELTQLAFSQIILFQHKIQDEWLVGKFSSIEANAHAKGMAQMCSMLVNKPEEILTIGEENAE